MMPGKLPEHTYFCPSPFVAAGFNVKKSLGNVAAGAGLKPAPTENPRWNRRPLLLKNSRGRLSYIFFHPLGLQKTAMRV